MAQRAGRWRREAGSGNPSRLSYPASRLHGGGLIALRKVRDDALPENINYVDTGCDVWHRCLTCPLPRCRYDEPGGARRLLNEARNRRIVELKGQMALPVDELARRYGLSRRSVFRILRKAARETASRGGGRAS